MTDTAAPQHRADTATIERAALWRRLAGLVYDLVAVVAIVMVVGMVCLIATGGDLVDPDTHLVTAWWYPPLQYIVVAAYFVASWVRGGQTLGMRSWHMRLRMRDGQPVSLVSAIIRVVVVSLPLLLLALGHAISPRIAIWTALAAWAVFYAVTLFDPRRRALHDIVAGTELVHTTARRKRTR